MPLKSSSIIFGVTADPIHLGHEQAIINGVEYCREHGIEIERFLLIPVYQPNLIADKQLPIASFDQRLAMCELVASRLSMQLDCDIQVSDIEKQIAETTGQKNYSFNTIRALNINSSDLSKWVPAFAGMTGSMGGITKRNEKCLFMVSADHFGGRWPKFRKWYKWQELLQICGLLINQRPDNTVNHNFITQLRQMNSSVFVVQNSDIVDVSSTEIRQEFDAEQIVGLLSSDVLNYIKKQGLY